MNNFLHLCICGVSRENPGGGGQFRMWRLQRKRWIEVNAWAGDVENGRKGAFFTVT